MSQPKKTSQKTTRERAAEAKAKADAEARRRDNRNRLIGGVIVVALIVLIFGGVWFSKKDSGSSAAPDSSAALPAGVDPVTYGVPFGTGTEAVPQLQLWEDFQCPACKQLEDTNGKGITDLATAGTIRLLWRPTTFLDVNLKNDSSARAAAAWGCAVDAGKAHEYHTTVFANQPTEGVGYTDEQLLTFGKDAGLAGAAYDTFSTCVADQKFTGWVTNSFNLFSSEAVPGTPAGYLVLGDKKTEVPAATMADQAKLEQAIKDFQTS